jgi:hypothetical protein
MLRYIHRCVQHPHLLARTYTTCGPFARMKFIFFYQMFRIENNFAEPFLVNNAEKTDYFPIKTISFHGSCILLLKIHNRILPNKLVDQSAVTLITSFHTWICSPREAGTRSSESSPVAVHFMLCAQSNSLTTSNVSLTTRIIYLQHLGQCYDPLCAMDKYTNV